MSIGFVPQSVQLVDSNGRMRSDWYRYFQDLHQLGGFAGATFPLWQPMLTTASEMRPDAGSPPAFAAVTGNVFALHFDAAATEAAHFGVLLPNGYPSGTIIKPVIRWAPTTTGAGVVRWLLEYAWGSVDDSLTASFVAIVDDTADAGAWKHQEVVGSDIPGTGKEPGSVILCRIARQGGAAEDTYAADAVLLAAGFYVQNTAVGTTATRP